MYLDKNGRSWYKGNLHTHTTNSDGRKTPAEAIALYRAHGYDFLSLTDHWKLSEAGEDAGLLLLSGIEYNINGGDVLKGVIHIVAVGVDGAPEIGDDPEVQTILDAVHSENGIAVLAHPSWSLDTPEQIMQAHGYDMTEIYNSVSDLPHNCRPYAGDIVDELAARGVFLPCGAADDTHFYDGEECKAYIYVQAASLTQTDILAAIRAGRFYATQGPRMAYTVSENENGTKRLHIDFSGDAPVTTVIFYTATPWIDNRSINGKDLVSADFDFRAVDKFVRAECIDENGRHGWLSPIPF